MIESLSTICAIFGRLQVNKVICDKTMAYYKNYRAIRKEANEWLNTGREFSHNVMEDEVSEVSDGGEMEVSDSQLPSEYVSSPARDNDDGDDDDDNDD